MLPPADGNSIRQPEPRVPGSRIPYEVLAQEPHRPQSPSPAATAIPSGFTPALRLKPAPGMIIRSAIASDVPAVASLERSNFGDQAYPAVFLRQAVDLWPDLICVADDNEALLGYALGAPSASPDEGWILAVAVRPDARGRGVGRALTQSLVDRLGKAGARRVFLTVHPGNRVALGLYRGLGFSIEREDPEYFGPKEPRLRLALSLKPEGPSSARPL